jgi:UDP-glucose 4-epimerase
MAAASILITFPQRPRRNLWNAGQFLMMRSCGRLLPLPPPGNGAIVSSDKFGNRGALALPWGTWRSAGVTVLITGGAGFVAATLVRRLLEGGESVLAVDNLSRGATHNLGNALRDPRFRFVEADVADLAAFRAAVGSACGAGDVTEVWHLAANSDIPAGVRDPGVDFKDTFLTTWQTVRLMEEIGARRLYFASSSAIYGDRGDRPLAEDSGPLFPVSSYGAMKLASEGAIAAAAERFLDRAVLFRFPNVVGVPATHGVILDFIRRLRADPSALDVLGDGTQQKAYLHVSDLVEAMLAVAAGPGDKIDAFNIGPVDAGVSVRWIAERTVAAVAPGATIRFGQGNKGWPGDVPRFRYSVDRMLARGWRPRLDSVAAVERAIGEIARQEAG